MTILDHEDFEGATVLAEIGVKIATARAQLSTLESTKEEYLDGRAAEAAERIAEVLTQSAELIEEIGKNHKDLVGYRTAVDNYLDDVRYLIQVVKGWKEAFDKSCEAKLAEIVAKTKGNDAILTQIKGQRALLAGEELAIMGKRAVLKEETAKILDEWATLERASKEINKK